jgi:ribose 5-phosphate isomerase B
MKVYLASDHAGFALKEKIKQFLVGEGYHVEDVGAHELDPGDDYPDFVKKAAEAVAKCSPSTGSGQSQCRGIVIGGSGEGEAMAVNRYRGVRAAVYYGGPLDIVKLSREHNDANVLSLGARFVGEGEALRAVELWLETRFSSEPRHVRRLEKF